MIVLNIPCHEVTYNSKEVYLSPVEFETVKMFGQKPGVVHSRAKIAEIVWAGRKPPTDSRTVDQHIARLRRKMRGCGIVTIPLYGYKAENKSIKVVA